MEFRYRRSVAPDFGILTICLIIYSTFSTITGVAAQYYRYPMENLLIRRQIGFDVEEARPGQFPWLAAVHNIQYMNPRIYTCGGSVISSRWVLTAGHCIAEYTQYNYFLIILGEIDRGNIRRNSYDGPGVAIITKQWVLHPEFDVVRNDIGLLYMPQDIPFGRTIQPIRIPGDDSALSFAGTKALTVGWGSIEREEQPQYLHFAKVAIITNKQCRNFWPNNVRERHICTMQNASPCKGDSGGPLVVRSKTRGYVQVGIVSFGHEECSADVASVYTRVSAFSSWIYSITNIHQH